MSCKLCTERGKTWNSGDYVCGFNDDGAFNPDNWGCATLNALRDLAERMDRAVYSNDSYAALLRHDDYGWLLLTWYKNRGRTTSVDVIHENSQHLLGPVTEKIALEVIEFHRSLKGMKQC